MIAIVAVLADSRMRKAIYDNITKAWSSLLYFFMEKHHALKKVVSIFLFIVVVFTLLLHGKAPCIEESCQYIFVYQAYLMSKVQCSFVSNSLIKPVLVN
jgi:hypothetical protein